MKSVMKNIMIYICQSILMFEPTVQNYPHIREADTRERLVLFSQVWEKKNSCWLMFCQSTRPIIDHLFQLNLQIESSIWPWRLPFHCQGKLTILPVSEAYF